MLQVLTLMVAGFVVGQADADGERAERAVKGWSWLVRQRVEQEKKYDSFTKAGSFKLQPILGWACKFTVKPATQNDALDFTSQMVDLSSRANRLWQRHECKGDLRGVVA